MIIYSNEKGRGLFRFDNRLLDDDDFVQTARQEILNVSEGQGIYEGVNNLGLKIEMLLSEIRVLSIKLSKRNAKERREEYNALIGNLDELDQEIADNSTIENVEKRRVLQELLDQAEERRDRLAMIRYGAR